MIGSSQYEHAARVGALSYEARHDDDLPGLMLRELELLLEADGGVYYELIGSEGDFRFGESSLHALDPTSVAGYSAHYHRSDPCLRALRRDRDLTMLAMTSTLRAIGDMRTYVETEYYQDFLRPQDIHTSIVFTLRDGSELLGLFGFQRPVQRRPFDDETEMLVRLVAAPIAHALARRQNGPQQARERHDLGSLTRRQAQVADLVCAGLTNQAIAARLGISRKTVEHHLTNLYDKTKTSNRVALAIDVEHRKSSTAARRRCT